MAKAARTGKAPGRDRSLNLRMLLASAVVLMSAGLAVWLDTGSAGNVARTAEVQTIFHTPVLAGQQGSHVGEEAVAGSSTFAELQAPAASPGKAEGPEAKATVLSARGTEEASTPETFDRTRPKTEAVDEPTQMTVVAQVPASTTASLTTEWTNGALDVAVVDRMSAPSSSTEEVPAPLASPAVPVSREGLDRLSVISSGPSLLAHVPRPSTTVPPDPGFARFSIAPWVSLDRSIYSDANSEGADMAATLGSTDALRGSAGVRLQYALDRHFALLTGLQLSRKGDLVGTIHSSSTEFTTYQLSGRYLKVPIGVRYTVPRNGKELYVRVGALLEFNAEPGTDKVALHDEGAQQISTLALGGSSMGVAIDLGVGVQFRLARNLGLFIEPTYQHALSPVVKYPDLDQLPFNPLVHSFGLCTGLSFQFLQR